MTQLPDPIPLPPSTSTLHPPSNTLPPTHPSPLTNVPIHEGTVLFTYPTLPADIECRTWYKVVGDLTSPSSPAPLVLLHGGPGACHNYLLNLTHFTTQHARPVIFYDQLGNGLSTHLRSRRLDTDFWRPELFIAELHNLLSHLGLGGEQGREYDVLGQSWGGMLGVMFAAERPKGLRRLVVSNSPSSMGLWVRSCGRWIAELPEEVRKGIEEGESRGEYEGREYLDVSWHFSLIWGGREISGAGGWWRSWWY